MLKRLLVIGSLSLALAQMGFADTNDALNLAGTYMCNGYDMHDGGYQNAKLVLTLDAKNSDFAHNYGAYQIQGGSGSTVYVGEIAASGNSIAFYFKNTTLDTDQGVATGVVTHDKDAKGNVVTAIHNFYYEPKYVGGGNGYETCVKQN